MAGDACQEYAELLLSSYKFNLNDAINTLNRRSALRVLGGANVFDVVEIHSQVLKHLVLSWLGPSIQSLL